MAKVITFSRTFPVYHPKKGQPTHFIEKLNFGLDTNKYGIAFGMETQQHFKNLGIEYSWEIFKNCIPKYHTIRAGNRWKAGDKFSPRIWSGKPYRSKQVSIAPDIEILKVWPIIIEREEDYLCIQINGNFFFESNLRFVTQPDALYHLAKNDGLSTADLIAWFNKKKFHGQIICWSNKINYE